MNVLFKAGDKVRVKPDILLFRSDRLQPDEIYTVDHAFLFNDKEECVAIKESGFAYFARIFELVTSQKKVIG